MSRFKSGDIVVDPNDGMTLLLCKNVSGCYFHYLAEGPYKNQGMGYSANDDWSNLGTQYKVIWNIFDAPIDWSKFIKKE